MPIGGLKISASRARGRWSLPDRPAKFKSATKLVDACGRLFRTRVRLPASPPQDSKRAADKAAFLLDRVLTIRAELWYGRSTMRDRASGRHPCGTKTIRCLGYFRR